MVKSIQQLSGDQEFSASGRATKQMKRKTNLILQSLPMFIEDGAPVCSRIINEPDFYLWTKYLYKQKLNVDIDPSTFRRLLNRALKRDKSTISRSTRGILLTEIQRLGRRRWGFQILMADPVARSPSPTPEMDQAIIPAMETTGHEAYFHSFRRLAELGRMNQGDWQLAEHTHPRVMAMEVCNRVRLSYRFPEMLAFSCYEMDFFEKEKPAIFCNEMVKRTTGLDKEKVFQFTVADEAGASFMQTTMDARQGQVVEYDKLPIKPKDPNDPYLYCYGFAFPYRQYIFMWGFIVPECMTKPEFCARTFHSEFQDVPLSIADAVRRVL